MAETGNRRGVLAAWLLVLLAAVALLATRLQFSYDLGLFLPGPQTAEQQVLLERLGDAPGTRYIMVALHDDRDDVALDEVADELADDPLFDRVLTDTTLAAAQSVPEPLWSYRYLLSEADLSEAGIAAALKRRIAELGMLGGGRFGELVRADPTLASLQLLEGTAGGGTDWRTADGRRLLLAETRAPAFQLDAQAAALARIEAAVAPWPAEAVEISGVGVFGIQLRDTIHAEAQFRSILASLALALVLLAAYRRLAPLWLAAVPLLTGLLVGLAVTALAFGRIHGITLAFGFTLLGIAIDYPLHVLSHARRRSTRRAVQVIWPTLRLGAASTMLAYLAIAVSGSEGLAQLGVFTVAGIAAAAGATRWVLPALHAGADTAAPESAPVPVGLRFWHLVILLVAAAAAVGLRWQGAFWNDDLSALSPIPQEKLVRDSRLRSALGAPDLRHLVVLRDGDRETLLAATQALDDRLHHAVDAGWIGDYRSASALLPAAATQARRRAALPAVDELRATVARVTADTPLRASAFEPFVADVERSRSLPVLTPESYDDSPLRGLLDQQLYRADDDWVSLVALFRPADPAALAAWLATEFPDARLVDLQRASRDLVVDYRQRTLGVLAVALALITGLLLWRTRTRRAVWSVVTMLTCMSASAALVFAVAGPLNLYHLIGLLLVGGLGLDYALFLSRPADAIDTTDSRHAVWACAASTFAAFGMLALSDIPALGALGTTVAIGTTLNVLAARCGLISPSDETPSRPGPLLPHTHERTTM